MTGMTKTRLYVGHVWHKRWRPVTHEFNYSVFHLLLDVDDLDDDEGARQLPWCLSHDRFNLFSVHRSDYLDRGSESLKDQVIRACNQADQGIKPTKVLMLTMPRVLGYAFNPITIFYCLNDDGSLAAILYEVRNTFGERHNYVYSPAERGEKQGDYVQLHRALKVFHVSPFFPIEGAYKFRQRVPHRKLSLSITYSDDDDMPLMSAELTGRQRKLTAATLMGVFLTIPLLGVKVIAAIHWQALLLRLKRVGFWRKPAPPRHAISRAYPVNRTSR